MITKFIPGHHSLADLQQAIAYEELAFRASTGAKIGNENNVTGNLVQFNDVSLPAGDFKLTFAPAPAPLGHAAAWTATVLVEGGPRLVTAWRLVAALKSTSPTAFAASAPPAAFTIATSEADALPALQERAAPSPYAVDNGTLLAPDGQPVKQLASPNQSAGNDRSYLVIHYTAGTSLSGAVSWFLNKAAKASAHLVIARDGSVVQMVPFTRRAWHAGESAWADVTGLNAHSIGIELVNAGRLRRTAAGWINWAGSLIADDDVTIATHRNEAQESGWHEYTTAQLDTLFEIAVALHDTYTFKDVLGHDDIAPARKSDPGPLFPMASIRARLFGRA